MVVPVEWPEIGRCQQHQGPTSLSVARVGCGYWLGVTEIGEGENEVMNSEEGEEIRGLRWQ